MLSSLNFVTSLVNQSVAPFDMPSAPDFACLYTAASEASAFIFVKFTVFTYTFDIVKMHALEVCYVYWFINNNNRTLKSF